MGEEDFKRFYDLLAGRIYSYAAQRVRGENAKDIVADTFETVWRKLDEAPADSEACAAWIFKIAQYKILQEYQRIKRKHHDNRFIEDFSPKARLEGDVAEVVVDRDLGSAIYRGLRERERELFDLVFVMDMPKPQICAVMNVSPGALKTRLSRLRDKLESLERDLTADGPVGSEASA